MDSASESLSNLEFAANIGKVLLTEKEAAKILRLSPVTLWRERKGGRISFRRIAGKLFYTKQDICDYLERSKQGFGVQNVRRTGCEQTE